MKILVLANHYNTLRIFRRELLMALAKAGHQVVISIPECDEGNRAILESYGTRVVFTAMERRGTDPLQDLALLGAYKKLIRREQPDKVISYTIKCNIYGALACKSRGIPHYANITGLGSAFQGGGVMRALVSLMYKFSLDKSRRVFFENPGDRDTLVAHGIVDKAQTVVLPGAGVSLTEFSPAAYPREQIPLRFLFIGRIMREKGVDEYFRAIRTVREHYPDARFDFIGWYEDRYEAQVRAMEAQGWLTFHGFQADVKPFIRAAHCIVHPSWHEGMSNTLLESAAMCRPLIASRIHGCMEAVEDGVSGYLFQVRSERALTEAMLRFAALSGDEKQAMGQAGRKRMEAMFDKNMVVAMTMNEIFAD